MQVSAQLFVDPGPVADHGTSVRFLIDPGLVADRGTSGRNIRLEPGKVV